MATLSVKSRSRSIAAGALVTPLLLASMAAPSAHAKNGDTHITGQGIVQTLDCNNATLLVNGTSNTINAKGTCWAVTLQGSSNIVIADNIINDVTVYGYDQTVIYHNGAPAVIDRGRELGMTNRINWAPA
ncbi:DUF3060 domain-containing protein [Mycobacterium frederiksbergense]|uniref:DUF3060 domain-containing protein n=1 Tax=Mycolicibacterium frederiksbergense TaxID=117567 RepID=A0A6H0S458_9MYCO|nr:DUF3060 domain-containing protein [Mycolicibacterium frederiksbergense]QIV81115.1 DUF3060 domain-containing protein [Mycolicibacterium frederiksbergense]